MLENSGSDAPAAATVKRYAPPNQRNRSLGRRKSGGDRLERANSYVNDVDRNPVSAIKGGTIVNHGDFGYAARANEILHAKLVPLQGCSNGEASQLLKNRGMGLSISTTVFHFEGWTAALNAYNSLPEDSAERPVLYARKSAAPWGHAILPHLLVQPTGGTGLQKDFLSELRQAMDDASPYS